MNETINQNPQAENNQSPAQPTSAQQPDRDVEENKIVAALSYLNILFLIPLFLKRESRFAQFHAKQGLVMFILFFAGQLIFWIPLFGWALFLLWLGADAVALVRTLQGQLWEIPIVNEWSKKISL
jgi:uncharacterized membrane protein